jgi:DNA-binding response OmpR family regulator
MLRRMMVRALREAGFLVEEAADGRMGLELVRSAAEPFHLVITDSRLPELSGPDMVQRLREMKPGLPIINVSGSHGQRTGTERPWPDDVPTLYKPFPLPELVRTVRELLDLS